MKNEPLTRIGKYIERATTYRNHHFRIKEGVGYYVVGGIEIPESIWEEHNHIPVYIKCSNKPKGENAAVSSRWLYDN